MSDVVMNQLLKMVSTMLPDDTEPANEISDFIEEKVDGLIEDVEIARIFKIMLISYCNQDPAKVYTMLVEFANDVADLNRRLAAEVENECEE